MLALGIVMLPPFDIGERVVALLLAVALTGYLVFYIFSNIARSRGNVFLICLGEAIIVSIVILLLILQQIGLIYISVRICGMLGFIIWIRSFASLMIAYVSGASVRKTKNSMFIHFISILVLSFGVYMIARPFIPNLTLTWILSIVFMLSGVAFGGLALLFAPKKKS